MLTKSLLKEVNQKPMEEYYQFDSIDIANMQLIFPKLHLKEYLQLFHLHQLFYENTTNTLSKFL
jgi:hypothetical protein